MQDQHPTPQAKQVWKIDNFIGVFDNYIPNKFCEDTINLYENKLKLKHAYDRFYSEQSLLQDKADTSVSLSHNNLPMWEEDVKNILVNFGTPLNFYLKRTGMVDCYGNNFTWQYDALKIQKTLPGEGYHVWHVEYHPTVDYQSKRVAFYIIYLNDDFTAGETEFLHQKQRVEPKTGRVVIAPAHFPYLHRGNPPLKGNKYILTGWLMLVHT